MGCSTDYYWHKVPQQPVSSKILATWVTYNWPHQQQISSLSNILSEISGMLHSLRSTQPNLTLVLNRDRDSRFEISWWVSYFKSKRKKKTVITSGEGYLSFQSFKIEILELPTFQVPGKNCGYQFLFNIDIF